MAWNAYHITTTSGKETATDSCHGTKEMGNGNGATEWFHCINIPEYVSNGTITTIIIDPEIAAGQ